MKIKNMMAFLAIVLILSPLMVFAIKGGDYILFWAVVLLAVLVFGMYIGCNMQEQGIVVTEEVTPAAAPAVAPIETGGKKSMRGLGKIYSSVADLMWVFTVVGFIFLLGIFPQVSTMVVPYYGGTVAQLLIMLMAPALLMLVFFNLLSGRWPVAEHRRRNVWIARLACGVLVLTALVVFLANKGLTGLPVLTFEGWTVDIDLLAKIALFGTIAFAVVDAVFTKGDDYVASSVSNTAFADLQQANANLRTHLAESQRENANLRAQLATARGTGTTTMSAPARMPTESVVTPRPTGDGFPFPIRPVILPAVYLRPGEQVPPYQDATPVATAPRPVTPVAEQQPATQNVPTPPAQSA